MKSLNLVIFLLIIATNVQSQETWIDFALPSEDISIYEIIPTEDSIYGISNNGIIITWDRKTLAYRLDSLDLDACQYFTIDNDHNFWIGTYGNGLLKFDGKKTVQYTTVNGLPSNVIYNPKVSPTGDLWVAGQGGISLFENDTCIKTYTQSDGLEDSEVIDIGFSPEGVLFVSTKDGGINYFENDEWKTARVADGAPRRRFAFRDNVLWYTNQSAGTDTKSYLTCTAPLTIKRLGKDFDWSYFIPILVDDEKDIWLTHKKGGCAVYGPFNLEKTYGTEVGFLEGSYPNMVKDNEGNIYFSQKTKIIIRTMDGPISAFAASETQGGESLEVSFTNTSSGKILSYLWDFGDGATSDVKNPNHVYNEIGNYTVSLVAVGEFGLADTLTELDLISVVAPPDAGFSSDIVSGFAPLSIHFSDSSTGNIASWTWDFGDGNSSKQQNPMHTYDLAGIYPVSLIVSGAGGIDTILKPDYITVLEPAPVAEFTSDVIQGNMPLSVIFSDMSENQVSAWAWDFGDGNSSDLQNPPHTYSSAGVYSVSLIVNGNGGADTIIKPDYITVVDATGISLKQTEIEIALYPNPTSDFLTIETPGMGWYSIEISSLGGRKILNENRESSPAIVDTRSFHKGVYFITIRSKDFVSTRKIIKL